MEMIRLSPREAAVLRLLRDGLSDREIADALGISIHTVRSHLEKIGGKLGLRKRAGMSA